MSGATRTSPLTFEAYLSLFPATKANTKAHYEAFVAALERFHINTPARIAAFCAQIGHESGGRTVFSENLRYKATQLVNHPSQRWRRIFRTEAIATEYAKRGPEAIANRAYAFVNGNGSEATGDGWKYRGRGDIQLTGLANYRRAEAATGLPLVSKPDMAADPMYSPIIAAWFWESNGLNELADVGDIMEITRRINGGTIGFKVREAYYLKAKTILGAPEETRVA